MTTTLPQPAPAVRPAAVHPAVAPACSVERRALAAGARDLADALTGIAFDEPCRPARQKAVLDFSAGVLRAVQAMATRTGEVTLHRACIAVAGATPVFAHDVSAGAPGLAGAWIALADQLDRPTAEHDHDGEDLLACERRFRAAVPGTFAVPMFADACTPKERLELVRAAPRRVRLALRLAEDRWTRQRDAVRG
jgi:hypothetical protein